MAWFSRSPEPSPRLTGKVVLTSNRIACCLLLLTVFASCDRIFGSTASTVTLQVTSQGSGVTSVASGTAVTLTATVLSGTTPVTPGLVRFCDTTVNAYCENRALLGTTQIISDGTASIKLRLGACSHSLQAVFVGQTNFASSKSPAQTLTVAGPVGPFPTLTGISSAVGTVAGTYNLTATVVGVGTSSPVPGGTVNFFDTTNHNFHLGSASLTPGSSVVPFIQSSASGAYVTADFNGDGVPDLLTSASVALGNGDGTFQPPLSYNVLLAGVVVGDFNGDGIPDIAGDTGNPTNGFVVLLGKGDGTFGPPQVITVPDIQPFGPTPFMVIAVGDFNNDGIPDLVAASSEADISQPTSPVAVFLGKGDGSFQFQSNYFAYGIQATSILAADFDGDGKLDLAVGTICQEADQCYAGELTIFKGNGDGTFQQSSLVTEDIYAVITADFNNDGIPDLLVNSDNNPTEIPNTISIFLGNGDGTFQAAKVIETPETYANIVAGVGDFNGDGILDIAEAGYILLGKSDGTFPSVYPIANLGAPAAIADFNGDGKLDLVTGSGVLLNNFGLSTAVATIAGVLIPGSGAHNIGGSYGGDSNFLASTAVPISLSASDQFTTTLSLSLSVLSTNYGSPVTLTASVSPLSGAGQSTDGDIVYFFNNGQKIGTATLSSGLATLTTSSLAIGFDQITATYGGDPYFKPSFSTVVTISVIKAGQTATAVTLGVTSSGTPVTSIAPGTVVTLTATVTSGTSPVTAGSVTFCVEGVNYICSGSAKVQTAQLTSSGIASIKLRPGVGTHAVQVIFNGVGSDGPSVSAVSSLVVTGTHASHTDLAVENAGAFSSKIFGLGPVTDFLGGTVQFIDADHSNTILATVPVGDRSFSPAATRLFSLSSQTFATGTRPFSIAAGDFNNDGIADLAVANSGGNNVSVLLGKGDGSYLPQVTYAAGAGSYALTTGDFNNDGYLDLAVANLSDNTISILLGNGDGTFQAQKTYPTGSGPNSVVAGDFDDDGILDLAVANQNDGTVSVLLGNRNGTFQTQVAYATGSGAVSVTTGDFNADGAVDLAVANNNANTFSVLLGNGDGTFQSQKTYATGRNPVSVTTGDFNGDGNLDVAVANLSDNAISVLLGKGDGSFEAQVTYKTGNSPYSVISGDFAGNGQADLATVNSGAGTLSLLVNEGTGIFAVQGPYPTGEGPISIVLSDLNGDGLKDLAVLNNISNTLSILLYSGGPTADTGLVNLNSGPGTHQIIAEYSGDPNYGASNSPPVTLTGQSETTKISLALGSSANPSNYGNPVTLLATLTPSSTPELTTNGESVTFSNQNGGVGTAVLSAGVATLTISSLPVGTNILTAKFPGDQSFNPSTSTSLSLTVRPATLTVTASNASRQYAAPNPAFTGTVQGAVNGDTFTVTGTTTATTTSTVGAYPIVPAVSGSNLSDYSVTKVNGTLTVTQAVPVITWPTPAAIAVGTALSSTQLNATANVPGAFVYSPAAGTVLAAGTATLSVTFTPADATDYTTATKTVQLIVGAAADYSISVNPTTLTIKAGSSGSAVFTVTPTGGFNQAINFACSGLPANSTCTFSPASVTPNGSPVTSTITIKTDVQSASLAAPRATFWLAFATNPGVFGLGGVFALCFLPRGKMARAWSAPSRLLFIGAALITAAGIISCGGGSMSSGGGNQTPVTPAGTSTVIVTATAGAASHTANLTVTVTN